ncbi:MAG: hypothetical protein DWG76_07830 [Chloroflexi bacterium]|nr:SUMF1/EgtB/PvdO family nonheme iron enzyme [Chloroflexota bacterium]MQC27336.1 hypothetical protein [Chloroflexota bacterium]
MKLKFWLLGIIVLLTFGAVFYLLRWQRLHSPITEETRQRALSGVETNVDWAPLVREKDGFLMMLVPAGCFEMGTSEAQLQVAEASCKAYFGNSECRQDFSIEQPSFTACLAEPYWIDRTEVTNAQYGSDSRVDSRFPRKDPDWPREAVTWEMAAEFCEQRGGRLPTEAEWEFAARGPDATIYPFGDDYDIQRVTLRKISPPLVGEHPEGASWVGAQDMSGGVAEWVLDWFGPYSSAQVSDPEGPDEGQLRIAKGGGWFAHAAYQVRSAIREPYNVEYASSSVGFRCALDFESP